MVYRQSYHIIATQKKEAGESHGALQSKTIGRTLHMEGHAPFISRTLYLVISVPCIPIPKCYRLCICVWKWRNDDLRKMRKFEWGAEKRWADWEGTVMGQRQQPEDSCPLWKSGEGNLRLSIQRCGLSVQVHGDNALQNLQIPSLEAWTACSYKGSRPPTTALPTTPTTVLNEAVLSASISTGQVW